MLRRARQRGRRRRAARRHRGDEDGAPASARRAPAPSRALHARAGDQVAARQPLVELRRERGTRSTPTSAPSATPFAPACAASSSARSRRTSTPGTRPDLPARALRQGRRRRPARPRLPRGPTAARRRRCGWRLIATEEVARAGSGGLMASLFSHSIGLPPIVAHGSEALQRRDRPRRARRQEDRRARDHRARRRLRRRPPRLPAPAATATPGSIDGEKTFITSGVRADWITRRRAHRRPGRRRHLADRRAGRCARPRAHAARQDGLVVQRHRAAALRRLPRAGRPPDRRRERRLSRDHGELQRRAAADVGRRLRLRRRSASTRRSPGRASGRPSASRSSSTRSSATS